MASKLDVSAEELALQSYTEYYSTGYGSTQSNVDYFADPRYYESVSVKRFVKLQKQEEFKSEADEATLSESSDSDETIVTVGTGNSRVNSSFNEASNEGSDIDINCDYDKY